MKKTILTGDRPTGPLHLGHYIGSTENRVRLQNTHRQFVIIADLQALTDNVSRPEIGRRHVFEVALDYLAAGTDPEFSTIFIQSGVLELAELNLYFLNLVSVARLERNPTVKTEIEQKGFSNDIPAGFLKPVLEQTNEIIRRFNRLYKTDCLRTVEGLLGKVGRLPGLEGRLVEVLEEFLTPIRARRAHYARDPGEILRLLREGTEKARVVAAQTLSEVRSVMGLDYFTGSDTRSDLS
jgi:tryptophanyl-tRNA synthetase